MNAYAINSKKQSCSVVSGKMHAVSHFPRRGFGIVEIGIVLVIVSMLLAVTLGYVRGVLADNRANDEAKDLAQTIIKIQRLYNNRSTYVGVTAQGLIGNGVFPAERVTSTTSVSNRWGGEISPNVTNLVGTSDAISLSYTNVPQLECTAFVAQVERSVPKISVNGTIVKSYSPSGGTLDINTLGTKCGSSNTLLFTFGVAQ